jgi:cold shock CspA family protein
MAESWNKKEREKKKQQQKKEKAEKKQERKDNNQSGNDLESMMAYIDENGNISSVPPDPSRKREVKAEDIEIGVPRHEDTDPADLVRKGTISFFNHDKGYGFIKDADTQESIFVHINAVDGPVQEQTKVTYLREHGPKGANAVNVKIQKV